MSQEYDAIVVGAGHNGLIASAYLAKAGLKVLVLERRHLVGGSCVTEEILPGFRLSTAAYCCGLLCHQIKEDLQLGRFGLEEHPFDPQSFHPFPDGKYLFFWKDARRTAKEIERFSKKDSKAYLNSEEFWNQFSELVDPVLLAPPPPIADMVGLFQGAEGEDLLRKLMFTSIADYLDEFFESEYVKAAMCTGAVAGTLAGPKTPGTLFVLSHHRMGNIGGEKGVWGWAKGGMGSITEAIASAAKHHGAHIRTDAEVKEILVEDGKARGVVLENGERILANIVVSCCDPKRTFLKLVKPEHLERKFLDRVRRIKTQSVSLKVNFALNELPHFEAYGGKDVGPQHRGIIDICPSVEYLEEAWTEAKYGRPSKRPFLEMFIQSAVDPTVAPAGKHTLTISSKYSPFHLKDSNWDEIKEEYAETVTETLAEYAPNIKRAIIYRQVITPLDLERTFGLTDGDVFHGAITPDQMFSLRPMPGWSRYRTPIENLYLCGAGTHPGGGVLGAPGYNAAQAILEDKQKGKR